MAIFTQTGKKLAFGLTAALFVCVSFILLYRIAYAGYVFPNVHIGSIDVGGLSEPVAAAKVSMQIRALHDVGIPLSLDGEDSHQVIHLDRFGLTLDSQEALDRAVGVGRTGSVYNRLRESTSLIFGEVRLSMPFAIDDEALSNEIASIASLYDEPGRDIRFLISGSKVSVLRDTKPGIVIDQQKLRTDLLSAVGELRFQKLEVKKIETEPVVDAKSVDEALASARRVMSKPLVLVYQNNKYTISPEEIGGFIESSSVDRKLTVAFDDLALSQYVATLGEKINTTAQDPEVVIKDNIVASFTPPRSGRSLQEEDTVNLLRQALEARLEGQEEVTELSLPVAVREPVFEGSVADLGIRELIGTATTSFVGSPKNRIANIKNGARFLTGILVKPGDEFSTLGALGNIDNSTGYLPELVIKGNRTVPEFGGGLCQVSTTLFRSVLNAGLPVTARQNHSYRVTYYEKDGRGVYIGPGLDATIYSPSPDFRFKNDTGKTILIVGHVEGLLITFDLYGTKDGRVASVDGPHTLTTVPSGPVIYAISDTIGVDEKRLLERAHPGGSAIATYKVVYADGQVKTQEFKSYYRPWPERWLVGTNTAEAKTLNTDSQTDVPSSDPVPQPTN